MADYRVVKNIGALARGPQNQQNTKNANGAMGDQGTVRVVLGGVEYVWGPNESKTLQEPFASQAVAADTRLKVADSQEGFRGSAIS